MIKYFRVNYCVGSSFSLKILEKFEGNGYVNDTACPIAQEKRFEQEDHWMEKLWTKYPYDLNDKGRDEVINKPVGLQFPSISRGAARTVRPRTTPVPTANTADAIF